MTTTHRTEGSEDPGEPNVRRYLDLRDARRKALREARLKTAIDRWWLADYSVEGLASKLAVTAEGQTSLGRYWADAPIIEFAGKKWTIFHLPLEDQEGNKSPKASWSGSEREQFQAVLFARALEGERLYNTIGGSERRRPRACFDGVVFPDKACPVWPVIVPSFNDAIFEGSATWPRNFHNSAEFAGATFLDRSSFAKVTFQQEVNFKGVTFSDVTFDEAQFQGLAEFTGAVFGDTTIRGAKFHSGALFNKAEFHQEVSFEQSEFGRGAGFDHSSFEELATFAEAKINWLNLAKAHFRGRMTFRDATFSHYVRSTAARFDDDADFSGRKGSEFLEDVHFEQCKFAKNVDFGGRIFRRPAWFSGTKFHGAPMFFDAELHESTSFVDCSFTATVGKANEDRFGDSQPRGLRRWVFDNVPFGEWLPGMSALRISRNSATKQLEDCYRTLRWLSDEHTDHTRVFYSLEMDTRRRRTDVSVVERTVLFLFWLTSGYGAYLGRPIGVLLAALLTTSAALWLVVASAMLPDAPPRFGDVVVFTSKIYLLPYPFHPAADRPDWVIRLATAQPIFTTAVSSICALISVGLAGVFAVTLRRRFALK